MAAPQRKSGKMTDLEVKMSSVFGNKGDDHVENQGNPIVTSQHSNVDAQSNNRKASDPVITDANLSLNPYASYSRPKQDKEEVKSDPFQTHGSVIKYEEIFCFRVLPLLVIIALSLISVEVMYGDDSIEWKPNKSIRSHQQKHIVSGALCGAMACGVVIYQYLTRPELKAYPNPLLLRQTLADLMVSCVLIALYMPKNHDHTISAIKEIIGGILCAFVLFLLAQLKEYIWLFNMAILIALLLWLNRLEFTGGFLAPRSCLIPSVVFACAFHMSIWRLPLISIDLYRTMINPFLEFHKSINQYDIFLVCYLVVVAVVFVSIQRSYGPNLPEHCPILRESDSHHDCFGMAAAWTFGNEAHSRSQPKLCFVPNRDGKTQVQKDALWAYPMIWLYSVWFLSNIVTVALSYAAYKRLVAGTSESIIARLRIIVANFRNIFIQLCWMMLIGFLDLLTYTSKSTMWPKILVFCLFARGLVDLICWFWINGDVVSSNEGVNVALTKEMTGYLMRGLQQSANPPSDEDTNMVKGFRIIALREAGEHQDVLVLTPAKFFKLVFGTTCVCCKSKKQKEASALSKRKANMESRKSRFSLPGARDGSKSMLYNDPLRYFTRGSYSVSQPASRPRNNSSFFKHSTNMEGPYLMEYMPDVFRSVRNTYGVSELAFKTAWGEGLELKLNEGGSSQAFFLFSTDKRFIVKSCTPKEMRLLRSMASEYAQHLYQFPESFLVRIYGAYNLVVYGTSFQFFVMENLFYYKKDTPLVINERYDIKGSTVNRNFSEPKYGESATCRLCGEKYVVGKKDKCNAHAQGTHIANVILKDCDLYSKFQISPDRAYHISVQLERDSNFLLQRNIMDYSLLVDIHTKQVQVTWRSLYSDYEPNEGEWSHLLSTYTSEQASSPSMAENSRDGTMSPRPTLRSQNMSTDNSVRHTKSRSVWLMQNQKEPTTQGQDCCIEASSIVGPFSYHLGIIDILQEWDWSKKLERFIKTTFLMKDPKGLSAVEPVYYQERFMVRIGGIMNLTDEGIVADTLPATFPDAHKPEIEAPGSGGGGGGGGGGVKMGYVNDAGSYQEQSDLEMSSSNYVRRMTKEEFSKEMRKSLSHPSSYRNSVLSTNTSHSMNQSSLNQSSQFEPGSVSQYNSSTSHSLDIETMSDV